MKVALVWPFGNDATYSIPLGLGYLVANTTNPEHTLQIFDGTLENAKAASEQFSDFLQRFQPDVVGVSCWSKTYIESVEILRQAKAILPHCTTVMGGIHPTAYPEKSIGTPEIDYLLTGECEFSFPLFLDLLSSGQSVCEVPGIVYRTPEGVARTPMRLEPDLDRITPPDYKAIRLHDYIERGYRYFSTIKMNAPIWLTRGCPYKCKFCTAPLINGMKIRSHSVEYAINWIKMLYFDFAVRHVNIVDDNFTFYADYTRAFCEALIRENLPGLEVDTANGIRAQRTDFETLKMMRRAGWRRVAIAPESGSRRVLKLMKKDLDPDMWPEKVKEIRRAGLASHALFLIGYPGETLDDLRQTAELIKRSDFDSLAIQYFQPMPGTPVYDDLVRCGQIEDVLLPNTTSEGRVYVTPELEDFNFGMFALKLYLGNFLRRPLGTFYELRSYSPALILRRLLYLALDAFFRIGKKLKKAS